MILKILLRVLFVAFTVTFAVYTYVYSAGDTVDYTVAVLYGLTALLISILLVLWEWRFQRGLVREFVAVIFGVAGGLIVTLMLIIIALLFSLSGKVVNSPSIDVGTAFVDALWNIQPYIPLMLAACLYLGITVVVQTRGDFRFLLPYIDFSQRGTQEGGIILDTSAIIDGRILDICSARIITSPIIIPDYVVRELQFIADSRDRLKRDRGRRGLDMLAKLQKLEDVRVVLRETDSTPGAPVDEELVRSAKELHARILTTDFNLNKVSQLEGIIVVNVNDLANAVKPVVLPGETLTIKIIREGQQTDQGVGYLDDGTMVVVENGLKRIGQDVEIVITGSTQTSAGRMIFGRPSDEPAPEGTTHIRRRQSAGVRRGDTDTYKRNDGGTRDETDS